MSGPADTGAADGPTPTWLDLGDDETIQWQDTRRTMAIAPTALGAALFVVAGLVAAIVLSSSELGLLVPVGGLLVAVGALALVGWQLLAIRNTEYVLTNERLYRKDGVLSLAVTTVDYETVQNVTYTQTITGRAFDHGTLAFDTAGGSGTELAFDDIDDPRPVENLVNERLARVRGESVDDLPGTTEQWEAVLEEVNAIRRAVDSR